MLCQGLRTQDSLVGLNMACKAVKGTIVVGSTLTLTALAAACLCKKLGVQLGFSGLGCIAVGGAALTITGVGIAALAIDANLKAFFKRY